MDFEGEEDDLFERCERSNTQYSPINLGKQEQRAHTNSAIILQPQHCNTACAMR